MGLLVGTEEWSGIVVLSEEEELVIFYSACIYKIIKLSLLSKTFIIISPSLHS